VVRSHEGRELCTTAITVAEILYGIERLPEGRRKEVLRSAAAEISKPVEDREDSRLARSEP
jgi:toxin FitB